MDSTSAVGDLPSALDSAVLASRLSGRRPAVFLDYDACSPPSSTGPKRPSCPTPCGALSVHWPTAAPYASSPAATAQSSSD